MTEIATCSVPEGWQCTIEAVNETFALYGMLGFVALVLGVAFAIVLAFWIANR